MNRRENWNWVKTLIISDNQVFHDLIIKPFDNQTVSLPWLSRIRDTSENKTERLDSDNQINISRLISFLGHYPLKKLFGVNKMNRKEKITSSHSSGTHVSPFLYSPLIHKEVSVFSLEVLLDEDLLPVIPHARTRESCDTNDHFPTNFLLHLKAQR